MADTIKDLYYGSIHPYKRKRRNEELVVLIDRHEHWLREHLDTPALNTLNKLIDCYAEFYDDAAVESFRDGFRIGGRLMTEILFEREDD